MSPVPAGAAPADAGPVCDLDVRVTGPASVTPGAAGTPTYTVTVTYEQENLEQTGTTTAPVTPDELRAFADLLERSRGTRGITRAVARADLLAFVDEVEGLGRRLFDALFDGERLVVFATAVENARAQGARLRVRLRLDAAPDLARLPWEVMRSGSEFLTVTDDRFVARFRGASAVRARPALSGALRVLVVAAAPTDLREVSVDREVAALLAELGPLAENGLVEVHRLAPPTLAALQDALKEPWHVFHFIGHGVDDGAGASVLLTAPDGTSADVTAAVLGAHLAGSGDLRLAVLNGCQTGTVPLHRPFDGMASRLVAAGVPAAVAMQFPVADTNAVRFATYLYRTLATGEVVDRAVAEGRQTLLETPDWVNPVLYLCADGRLFDVPPRPPVLPPLPRPVDRVPPGLVPAAPRFTPRGWLAGEFADWLTSDSRLLLFTGDHGAGKSVACAWLAGVGEPPAGEAEATALDAVRSAWHAVAFCSAALVGGTTSARSFVLRLSEQFARTVPGFTVATGTAAGRPEHLVQEGAGIDELFARAVEDPLRAALHPGDPPVVVLVDGLDEATGPDRPTILDLLARLVVLDVPVKVALAGPGDQDLLAPFERVRGTGLVRVDLSAEGNQARCDADVRAFVDRTLPPSVAGDEHLKARLVANAAGNFLYAESVVQTLANGGDRAVAVDGVPPDLADLYDLHLREVLRRALGEDWRSEWAETLAPVFGFLAVAQAPVPAAALQGWLGWTRPRLGAVLDGFQQVVRSEGGRYRLFHRAFAAHLCEPADVRALAVDEAQSHRRIVEATATLTDADLAHARDLGGDYGLVHAPAHLRRLLDLRTGADLVDPLAARMLSTAYLTGLAACVADPVQVGEPYRTLADVLLTAKRWADVERVVRFVSAADATAVRACVFDVLVAFAEADAERAAEFVTDLALGPSKDLAASALHATIRLPARAQAGVFRRVVAAGDAPLRRAAAYALYANGAPDPQSVLRDVLGEVLRDLPLSTPWRLRAPLEFFTQVSITNYISSCHDPAVTRLTADLYRELLVDRLHVRAFDNVLVERLVSRLMAALLSARVLSRVTGPRGPDGREQVGRGVRGTAEAVRVIPALDPSVPLEPLEDDVRTLLTCDALVLRILGALVIAVHSAAAPGPTADLVRRLAASGEVGARRWALLAHTVVLPGTPDAWVPLLEDLTQGLLDAGAGAGRDAADPGEGDLAALDLLLTPLALAYAKAQVPMTVLDRVFAEPGYAAWRPTALTALGAVGLHRPESALAAVDHLRTGGWVSDDDAVRPLALMAGVHPLQVRSWVLSTGDRALLARVEGRTDVDSSRLYLDVLGHYNNGVHQALHYPKMRRGICATVFTHFIDSTSRAQWSRRYARDVVQMLREADYDLMRWTD